ncbi:MAG: sucrase ferredoxin [Gaiellaceae bacterium]
MDERRPLCAEVSRESAEHLAATASRIENWILLEYRGLWSRDILAGSGLSDQVKAYLREQLAALPRSRLLFVRRPERRQHPEHALYVARTAERGSILLGAELGDYAELRGLDLVDALETGAADWASPVEGPLLVVCTHGKRDRCCAKFGRPLYDAVREQAEEGTVWQASHVGGDRFAGNLVSLPAGLYFGRVERAGVWALLDEVLAGRVPLERYRGRSCYSFAEQAAERAVRETAGATGPDDLALLSSEPEADGWIVRFEVSGSVHEVTVATELGEPTYLTCEAASLSRPRRFVPRTHRVVSS